jgi:hypothetical protein
MTNLALRNITSYIEELKCRKILRHGADGFTSHPKEGVLRVFIAFKNPSPSTGLELWF